MIIDAMEIEEKKENYCLVSMTGERFTFQNLIFQIIYEMLPSSTEQF